VRLELIDTAGLEWSHVVEEIKQNEAFGAPLGMWRLTAGSSGVLWLISARSLLGQPYSLKDKTEDEKLNRLRDGIDDLVALMNWLSAGGYEVPVGVVITMCERLTIGQIRDVEAVLDGLQPKRTSGWAAADDRWKLALQQLRRLWRDGLNVPGRLPVKQFFNSAYVELLESGDINDEGKGIEWFKDGKGHKEETLEVIKEELAGKYGSILPIHWLIVIAIGRARRS
jgi:hypothetical protein